MTFFVKSEVLIKKIFVEIILIITIFFSIATHFKHLHPLQVENCDSNSRFVVDEDDNGLIQSFGAMSHACCPATQKRVSIYFRGNKPAITTAEYIVMRSYRSRVVWDTVYAQPKRQTFDRAGIRTQYLPSIESQPDRMSNRGRQLWASVSFDSLPVHGNTTILSVVIVLQESLPTVIVLQESLPTDSHKASLASIAEVDTYTYGGGLFTFTLWRWMPPHNHRYEYQRLIWCPWKTAFHLSGCRLRWGFQCYLEAIHLCV